MAASNVLLLSMIALTMQWTIVSAGWYGVPLASVGTFNSFLFRGAPGFTERKEQLINTLKDRVRNQSPDVLCIQELFRTSDVLDVANAVKSQYPFQASFINLSDPPTPGESACTLGEITAVGACLQQSTCGSLTGDALINCTLVQCREVVAQASSSCRFCGGSEGGDLTTSFTQCATTIPASEYTDTFGLLLLSRYRLTDIEAVDYHPGDSLLIPRGYISAKVPSLRSSVMCTHLQADIRSRDYFGPPQFKTYAEQQADEVKTVLELVEDVNPLILLGDFNHGPATPGLPWSLPLNYGLMTARGLFSVNALWCGLCTFCAEENELAAPSGFTGVIDHIYLPTSRISAVFRASRLFDDIKTPSGLPLSDHQGVRAALLIRRASRAKCPSSDVLGRHVDFLDLDDIDEQVEQFCPAA